MKLTNKKLQEVKNNYYAVYTFDGDGRRSGTISGCNIVRAMEEAQNRLCLIFSDELEKARVPRELFADMGMAENRKAETTVWMWVLEIEAKNKRRATWQEVEQVFDIARTWLKTREVA